jgi:large subunit ribosomal protein L5
MKSRLLEKYRKEVVPHLTKRFGYKNIMAVPRVEKVVVNIGFGRQIKEGGNFQEKAVEALTQITGQKPVLTKARKSIAGFKLREGQVIGAKVTLRANRMYDFMDRLISVALPRSRDFRGIDPKAVDPRGNLTIGIKEDSIFPEIIYETTKDVFGLETTITTTANTAEEGEELLRAIGFPLKSEK